MLRIIKDIFIKYSKTEQLFYAQRKTRSSLKNIAVSSYSEEWVINNVSRRKRIKDFIKVVLNIEKNAKLDSDVCKITSLNEFLSKNMRNWNNINDNKDKNKQRKLIKKIWIIRTNLMQTCILIKHREQIMN